MAVRFRIFAAAGLCILAVAALVFAAVWSDSGSSLAGGEFNGTLYDSAGEFVHLNWTDWSTNDTYVWNGTYDSDIHDFGSAAHVFNVSWVAANESGSCPDGMAYIPRLGGYCIDKYEAVCWNASGWVSDSNTSGWNSNARSEQVLSAGGYANSTGGFYPWVYINLSQARQACANAGKYLCTSLEWLSAANIGGRVYYLPAGDASNPIPLGASDSQACVTYETADCDHSSAPGGGNACWGGIHGGCVSAEGVYDMVGNVWEWCNETVDTTGAPCTFCTRYINSETGEWSSSSGDDDGRYGKDYTYFGASGTGWAVIRGRAWGDEGRAGVFAVFLYGDPSGVGSGIGFRCCAAPN